MKTPQPLITASANNSSCSNLVFNTNNQATTNSILVANKFGKRHDNVIRGVESLILANSKLSSLYKSATYTDKQGKKRPMYIMNRDGFTLLVMGFTGKDALDFKLDYINAFNTMEKALLEIQIKGLVSAEQFEDQKNLAQYWQQVATNKLASTKPKEFYLLTDAYYNQIMKTVAKWIECENVGSYAPSHRDQHLVTRLEAIRMMHVDYSRNSRIPFNVKMCPAHF